MGAHSRTENAPIVRGVLLTILRLLGLRARLLSILAVQKRRFTLSGRLSEVRCLPCLGARPRPQPRTGPATCRANWLVGGRRRRRRIVVSSGQCMQLCVRPELVARADACAVLRTWFSRRGRPRGETSREHSRQGPQGRVPRDHTAFSCSLVASLVPPRCPVHPTHGVS